MEIQEIKATKPSYVKGCKLERKRVAAYCRVSKDNEEQLNSYESQKKYYTDLIQKKKEWHFSGIYADEAITGTQVAKRVDFQRMINDCLKNEIDMIITKSISRFARNTYDTLKYVRMLKEENISVFFEEENIDTMTMDGELLLTILSSVAQQEVQNISENVKKGLKMKMKRGELVGFHGCLGYDYDKNTKSISVNKLEAKIVQYIFDRYVAGLGATIIKKDLDKKNLKTKRGNSWTNSGIIGIIRNEKYVGDLLMGKTFTLDPISKRRLVNNGEEDKYYIKDHHEPIVDRETFEKANKILSRRSFSRKSKDPNVTREKYSRKYAFSSMLECHFCGKKFSRRAWHSSTKYSKVVWQCSGSAKIGRKHCEHSKAIPEEMIKLAFLESYAMICGNDRELVDSFIQRIENTFGVEALSKNTDKTEKKLIALEKKKKKLINLMLEDELDKSTLGNLMYDIGIEEKKLKETLHELNIKVEHEKDLKERILTLKKALNDNIRLEKFDRHIFESLIEKVIIGSIDEDGNVDPYNIIFVYKTGLNNSIDGIKFRKDKRKKINALPSNKKNEVSILSTNSINDTYSIRCKGIGNI